MVDIPVALAAIGNAYKIVTDLRAIDREFNAAELKLKIAELTGLLADVKLALTDARTEMGEKDSEIARLKSIIAKRTDSIVEYAGYRYDRNSEGLPIGLPYCPVCEAKHQLFIHMTNTQKPGIPKECPNCKALFQEVREFEWS